MNTLFEDADRNAPITDIEFIARSVHRLDTLRALAERPHSRLELRVVTGASPPTVCRLLRDFEARQWTIKNGHRYELTQLGAFVTAGFIDLLDRMETGRTLRDVMRWLPVEKMDIDLRCFADATVTLGTQSDPLAPMKRAGELFRSAARSRVLTHSLPEPCFVPYWEAVTNGVQRYELVITAGAIEAVAVPSRRPQFEAILDADRTRVFVYDGEIPQIIGINDGIVFFGIDDERGAPVALIESENETVVLWAEETFESYRERAEPLDSVPIPA
ncbi:MAG TPA: hypothetical protein VFJ06_10860 [Halococcus sp.]|nr:hypothetical protein [Halococcus sp.]